MFTLIIFAAPLIYSVQPLLLSRINVVNKPYDKETLKRKKILLYRQIKELEMEFDIGNLNQEDFCYVDLKSKLKYRRLLLV